MRVHALSSKILPEHVWVMMPEHRAEVPESIDSCADRKLAHEWERLVPQLPHLDATNLWGSRKATPSWWRL